MVKTCLFSLVLTLSLSAWAEVDPWFGPEFTMTNATILNLCRSSRDTSKCLGQVGKAVEQMFKNAQAASESLKVGGNFFASNHRLDFMKPRGFINFHTDMNVVEVNTAKDTLSGFVAKRPIYEPLIFGAATASGLAPDEEFGGGHVHIGRVFADDPQLLIDFVTDFYNNSFLAAGILRYSPESALALFDMDPSAQLQFIKLVLKFARLRHEKNAYSSQDFARQFHEEVLAIKDGTDPFNHERLDKEFALNLQNLFIPVADANDIYGNPVKALRETVEVRSIAAQKNYDDYLSILRLFKARLNWLKKHPSQLPRLQLGPMTLNEAKAEFKKMILETGLDWNEYQRFEDSKWAKAPDVAQRQNPFRLYNYTPEQERELRDQYAQVRAELAALPPPPGLFKRCIDALIGN